MAYEDFEDLSCCVCFIKFYLPKGYKDRRREDHQTFYCPNGHSNYFPQENETEKLRRERDRLAQQIAQRDDEIKRERENSATAWRTATAEKEKVARLKKRQASATCPCCKRTFIALAMHMTKKHPTFVAHNGGLVVPFKKASP